MSHLVSEAKGLLHKGVSDSHPDAAKTSQDQDDTASSRVEVSGGTYDPSPNAPAEPDVVTDRAKDPPHETEEADMEKKRKEKEKEGGASAQEGVLDESSRRKDNHDPQSHGGEDKAAGDEGREAKGHGEADVDKVTG